MRNALRNSGSDLYSASGFSSGWPFRPAAESAPACTQPHSQTLPFNLVDSCNSSALQEFAISVGHALQMSSCNLKSFTALLNAARPHILLIQRSTERFEGAYLTQDLACAHKRPHKVCSWPCQNAINPALYSLDKFNSLKKQQTHFACTLVKAW